MSKRQLRPQLHLPLNKSRPPPVPSGSHPTCRCAAESSPNQRGAISEGNPTCAPSCMTQSPHVDAARLHVILSSSVHLVSLSRAPLFFLSFFFVLIPHDSAFYPQHPFEPILCGLAHCESSNSASKLQIATQLPPLAGPLCALSDVEFPKPNHWIWC